jgi:hypothetical protein
LDCRSGCAACCIAPSITTLGKAAGVRCEYLDGADRCTLYGDPRRPRVCGSLQPTAEMCGGSREEALAYLVRLEAATRP